MAEYAITARNRVRRLPEKARYDAETVHGVLDAGLVAHVGFVHEERPTVIPMLYGRDGERLLLHGAGKARIARVLGAGAPACANVTLLDGIVAARSAFNSSMNYRSAVVFGTARLVEDADACLRALRVISEHVMPGRWDELRAPTEAELRMTAVIELAIESASAKVAAGPPEDAAEDYAIPVWAGVVPIATALGRAQGDGRLLPGVAVSPAVAALQGRVL